MYLLDTPVIAELRRARSGKADPHVVAWSATAPVGTLYLSALTILELETGVLSIERRDGAQGRVLRTWLEDHVLPTFDGRVLPIDSAVARRCGGSSRPHEVRLKNSTSRTSASVSWRQ